MVEIRGNKATIGVLALQGDFEAHIKAFEDLGWPAREIRWPKELEQVNALTFPGGESTTMLKFIREEGFENPLIEFGNNGKPILATCAGTIILSANVVSPPQSSLKLIDIDVVRNGYGRQVHSSIHELKSIPELAPLEGVFIRAPRVTRTGRSVEVLAWLGDDPVLLKQGKILAATFHPELSRTRKVHEWFLKRLVLGLEHTAINS